MIDIKKGIRTRCWSYELHSWRQTHSQRQSMLLAITAKDFGIKFLSFAARRFLHSIPFVCGNLSSAVSFQESHLLDPLALLDVYKKSNQFSVANTKCFHSQLIKFESLRSSVFVTNSLVDCYCKCSDMWDAMKVFEEMPERDVVSWNIVISGCNNGSLFAESWMLFRRMHCSGYKPDELTYGTVLSTCVALGDLACGMQVYALVNKSGFGYDGCVRAGMIRLFARNFCLGDASKVFSDVPSEDDVVCWNAMISGAVKNGENWVALDLFKQMCAVCGLVPNNFIIPIVITACSALGQLLLGQGIYGWVIKHNYDDLYVSTSLVDLYSKCGDLEGAMKLFRQMPVKSVVSWTAIISGFMMKGDFMSALGLFKEMRFLREEINSHTITSLLTVCSRPSLTETGSQMHAWIIRCGFDFDPAVAAALIIMYSKIGDIGSSESVFVETESARNSTTWTAMVSAFAQDEDAIRAMEFFRWMLQDEWRPDRFCVSSLLSATDSLSLGEQVHTNVIKFGLVSDVCVSSSLFTMYSECGGLEASQKIFERIREKDNISWTSMMAAFVEHGSADRALQLFKDTLLKGMIPDEITLSLILTAIASLKSLNKGKQIHACALRLGFGSETVLFSKLVGMYCKCDSLNSARKVFDSLPYKDEVSSSSLFSLYARNGCAMEAMSMFRTMLMNGFLVDAFRMSSILVALSQLDIPGIGVQMHAYIIKAGLQSHASVGSSLVKMYSDTCVEDCVVAYNQIEKHDVVSMTAMIMSYARHGKGEEALRLFGVMKKENIRPDPMTFAGVLSACSHSGLIEEGLSLFSSMVKDYGMKPNYHHYACIVDLLGRAGRLKEVERFINDMPIEPSAFIWETLLAACKVHGNIELGKIAASKVTESKPLLAEAYISISNICAELGQWENVLNIRKMMEQAGANKEVGRSVV